MDVMMSNARRAPAKKGDPHCGILQETCSRAAGNAGWASGSGGQLSGIEFRGGMLPGDRQTVGHRDMLQAIGSGVPRIVEMRRAANAPGWSAIEFGCCHY